MEAEGERAREGETQTFRKRVNSTGIQLQKSRGNQTQTKKQEKAAPEGVRKRSTEGGRGRGGELRASQKYK